jgi:hypothetical protein
MAAFFVYGNKFGIFHSYYFCMSLTSNSKEKPKRGSASRKKWLRIAGISFLVILFLEFVFYFGANIFLGSLIRKRVNESVNGVYELEFNRVHLSLIRRGIFLDGIVMKPIHPEKAGAEQKLFELTLDELAFTGLWYGIWDQELYFHQIRLDVPNFQVLDSPKFSYSKPEEGNLSRNKSPIVLLESELKKSLRRLPFSAVTVGSLVVDHAQVFFLNFLSQNELLAKDASFKALDLHWIPNQSWQTPFNARGFEFELEEATFSLPDGVHRITSDRVFLSSLEQTIDLQKFTLVPDLSKESTTYYALDLAELHIGQVDLNQAFRSSTLAIEELKLKAPRIEVIKSSIKYSSTGPEADLHAFIRGKLNEFSIKELSIQGASFLKRAKEDSLSNRIQLEQLDLNMVDFYLGEDSLKRRGQFFYGSDASMKIGKAQVFLSGGTHLLSGEKLEASTFKNELTGTNLKLSPPSTAAFKGSAQPTYRLDLAEFTFENVDLKKWYRQGDLEIETLSLLQPKLEIRETNSQNSKVRNSAFIALLSGLIDEVAIQTLTITEGELLFKEESGQKSKDLELGTYSVELENLKVQPSILLPFQEQFQFQEIKLTLFDYRLKLRDNLHEFLAEELTINSKKERLEIKNLSIHPAEPTQVREQLQALGKTSAVDFIIPLFRAEGIGFKEALFDQRLHLNHLQLDAPIFYWSTYRSKESKASQNALQSAADLKDLLLGYFKTIQVDSARIANAKIRYENKVKEAVTRFEEDKLFLTLKNFSIEDNDLVNDNRTLFSDEVNLTFNSYSFSLAGGKYLVDTDYLNYNSRTRTLDFENLRLLPGKVGNQRLALGFNFPKVALRGVNMEAFIFDNVLNLEKLEIDGGELAVGLDRQIAASDKTTRRARNLALQRAVEQVHIDTITTSNATLQLNYLDQNQSTKAIKTGFGLNITQFDLDSLRVRTQDLTKTYQGINLGLSNFEFALPDSVHTLKFEVFGFGEDLEELVFSGLSIHPKNQMGMPGKPIFDGKIERVVLKKNSLLDILTTKKVDLREVRVENPVFSINLDSLNTPSQVGFESIKKTKEGVIQSLVLGDLVLENGKFDFFRKGGQALSNLSFPKVDARLEQLGIDLLAIEKLPTWKELLTKTKSLSLANYKAYVQDSAYYFQLDSLRFLDQNLYLQGLHYRPRLGIYGYLNSFPFQREAVTARVEILEIHGIEPQKLIQDGLFKGEFLQADRANVVLFRDKRKPMDPNSYKPLPQYWMEHAPITMDLSSFQFRDSRLEYWEFGEKSSLPGSIAFQNVQLDASPFFLRKQGEPYPVSSFHLGLSGQVSDSSQLNLTSQLYFEKGYPMDVSVSLDRFAFAEAEDLLSKTAFVKPLAGGVTQGIWQFRLNEQEAIGSMALGYAGLKLQFLDTLTLGQGKGKLKFYTLLANLWVKKSNPGAGSNSLRKREIYRLRDTQRSMVNAWWKATFVGVKSSIGFGRAKVPKNLRKEEEN